MATDGAPLLESPDSAGWGSSESMIVQLSTGYPVEGSGPSSSSTAPRPQPLRRSPSGLHEYSILHTCRSSEPPTSVICSDEEPAFDEGPASAPASERPCVPLCKCGNEVVDSGFLSRAFSQFAHSADNKCRECRGILLLQEHHVEVDKYCYSGWVFSRKRKLLRLSKDLKEMYLRSEHQPLSWQAAVPIHDLIGVVFGAYTCTFKKQSSAAMPPHWSAFSLIGSERTYDFSARDPEVVECCVRTFQNLLWKRRHRQSLENPHHRVSTIPIVYPGMGAFEPWPLGLFLWMRLRFRLQEAALKRNLQLDHMLWTVFMTCAFLSTSDVTKARFIDMAEKLQEDHKIGMPKGTEVRDLSSKMKFQKEREMDIVKDRYQCDIHVFLPHAPRALNTVGASRAFQSEEPSVVLEESKRSSHSSFSLAGTKFAGILASIREPITRGGEFLSSPSSPIPRGGR